MESKVTHVKCLCRICRFGSFVEEFNLFSCSFRAHDDEGNLIKLDTNVYLHDVEDPTICYRQFLFPWSDIHFEPKQLELF